MNQYKRGYGVATPDRDPVDNQWNGRLKDGRGQQIHFWIEDIAASFQMAGSTAQSRRVRQFFAHNMVQPSVSVTCRAPNSYQFNRLAQFVREAQFTAVAKGASIPTIQLLIKSGNPFSGRNVKGKHKTWLLEGYVKGMPAGGKRFDHAPQFTFEFLIAESHQKGSNIGIWSDTVVRGNLIKPWIDIFKSRGGQGFVTSPGSKPRPGDTDDVGPNIGAPVVDEAL